MKLQIFWAKRRKVRKPIWSCLYIGEYFWYFCGRERGRVPFLSSGLYCILLFDGVGLALFTLFFPFSFQVKRVREKKNKPPKTSHTRTRERRFWFFLLKAGELACFSLFIRGRGILVFTSIKKLGLHVIIVKKFGIERRLHRPTSCPSLVCSSSARR